MGNQIHPPKGIDGFPNSIISASDLLIPITSWSGMVCESKITGVIFDQFWYDSIKEGVCQFYRWLGKPRATVLVICDEDSLDHIECQTLGDRLIPRWAAMPILAEVVRRYREVGYWAVPPVIDERVYPCDEDDSIFDDAYRRLQHEAPQAGEQIEGCLEGADSKDPDRIPSQDRYEDPDYSKETDVFSDPVAAARWNHMYAESIGIPADIQESLWPVPK